MHHFWRFKKSVGGTSVWYPLELQ